MERQCQLAEVSRAGFYRHLQQTLPEQADLLRARLQELAVAHHRLRGHRMLTELRYEGQVVNHKRVLRLMARRQPAELMTDEVCVYDGFAAHYPADLSEPGAACEFNEAQPVVGGGAITFIRLRSEFVYLAVVLDAYRAR